ncbi:MAG: ribulose-phosphate 3-epimerase [Oscillospiraceae bacterium]|nr:ribulose-phosphate 3-epimerase [Oscillospiraceae bacterium]
MLKIAPSILAADFARLGEEIEDIRRGGADYVHVDVMDGCFVPNISVGIPVLASLRKATDMFLDVHLMIDRPVRYVERFCRAGADLVNVHAEADSLENNLEALRIIRANGKKSGVTLKPATPAEAVRPYLELVDLVLIMTVEPGFGGQSFMADMMDKVRAVRRMLDAVNPGCDVEVDGGVDPLTAPLCKAAGANVLVAGSAVFGRTDRAAAIEAIRNS